MDHRRVVFIYLLAFLALCIAVSAGAASDAAKLITANVNVMLPEVKVHVKLMDQLGQPIQELKTDGFGIKIDNSPQQLDSVSFFDVDQGTLYIIILDTSLSMTRANFDYALSEIEFFIKQQIRPKDHIALVTFGDQVKLELPATQDKKRIVTLLGTLKRTGNKTQLYDALYRALDVIGEDDPNLPSLKTFVVISDGLDDGSETTFNEIWDRTGKLGIPVYAICDQDSKDARPEDLKQLAGRTGGTFIRAAAPRKKGDAFQSIIADLGNFVVLTVDTGTSFQADGEEHNLEVSYSTPQGERFTSFRELPFKYQDEETMSSLLLQRNLLIAGMGAGTLLLVIITWLFRRKRKKRVLNHGQGQVASLTGEPTEIDAEESPEPDPTGEIGVDTEGPLEPSVQVDSETAWIASSRSPQDVSRGIRQHVSPNAEFIVIKGNSPKARYLGYINENGITIGRNRCDINLKDEGIESPHTAIHVVSDRFLIQNLAKESQTYQNGIPLAAPTPLEENGLIEVGQATLRFKHFKGQ